MLQEVKTLSDQNRFISSRFSQKYPSFYSFRKILIEKKLLEKKINKEIWIGIEPNLIMAEAIATLREKRFKEAQEKRSINLTKEDLRRMVEQKKAFDKQEELEELEELEAPIKEESIEKEETYNQMKIYSWESVQELEHKLQEVTNANASLIRQIGQIQNSKFFWREFVTGDETTDAKLEKLREVIRIRDTELAKAYKKNVQFENSFNALQKLSIEQINSINEKDTLIKSQKQEIFELSQTISHQREAIKKAKENGSIKTSTLDQFETAKNEKDETAISILIKDLETSSKLQTEEGEKLLLRVNKILVENYLEKERSIIIKHLFNFYADLSRQMNVPENLVSENLTHAEIYFDRNFYL